MLKSVGVAAGHSYNAGTEVSAGSAFGRSTVPMSDLEGWVRAGLAVPIPEQRVETADTNETETTAAAKPRKREKKNG